MDILQESRKICFSAGFAMHGFILGFFLSQLFFGQVPNPLAYLLGVAVFLAISFRYS